jgi:hypothetical protein
MEYTFECSSIGHLLMSGLGHICNYMLGVIPLIQLMENLVAIII